MNGLLGKNGRGRKTITSLTICHVVLVRTLYGSYTQAAEHQYLACHPIPVIVLARLGVDTLIHDEGDGSALLRDAMTRTAQAADTIGARALLGQTPTAEAMDRDLTGYLL